MPWETWLMVSVYNILQFLLYLNRTVKGLKVILKKANSFINLGKKKYVFQLSDDDMDTCIR